MNIEGAFDPNYEYNAPQFVDFEALGKGCFNDENVESYFDFDHEAGEPVSLTMDSSGLYEDAKAALSAKKKTPSKKSTPSKKKTPQRASTTPTQNSRRNTPRSCRSTPDKKSPAHAKKPSVVNAKENHLPNGKEKAKPGMPQIKAALSNICTNIEEWRNKCGGKKVVQNNSNKMNKARPETMLRRHRRSMSAQSVRTAINMPHESATNPGRKRTSTQEKVSIQKLQKSAQVEAPKSRGRTLSANNAPVKSRTSSAKKNTSVDRANSKGRSGSLGKNTSLNSSGNKGKKNDSVKEPVVSKKKLPLTIPATPSFMKRKSATTTEHVETREERAITAGETLRKQLAEKRKLASASYKQVQQSIAYVPKHSDSEVTKPQEFKFATDDRIKEHTMQTRQDHNKDFKDLLRKQSPKNETEKKQMNPTVPHPFSFAERKRKQDSEMEAPSPYVPMAAKVKAFERKTPDRFHTKKKKVPTATLR